MHRGGRVAISLTAMLTCGWITWAVLHSQLPTCEPLPHEGIQHPVCITPTVSVWPVLLTGLVVAAVAWFITGRIPPRGDGALRAQLKNGRSTSGK